MFITLLARGLFHIPGHLLSSEYFPNSPIIRKASLVSLMGFGVLAFLDSSFFADRVSPIFWIILATLFVPERKVFKTAEESNKI